MSEDTNDLISDDAAMENSEFEISETEVTIDKQSTPNRMDTEVFEAKLTEFFTKYKKSKLRFVSRIAFEFKGQEAFVLEHLHNKYVLGIVPEKPQKKIAHKSEGHDDHSKNAESTEVNKPKSKKKLIIFIIIGVVLSGLGVTGFMMKDKLMGMIGGGHGTEHGAAKAETVGESHHEASKHKKELTPKVAVLDSTKTTGLDSAKTITADSAKAQ